MEISVRVCLTENKSRRVTFKMPSSLLFPSHTEMHMGMTLDYFKHSHVLHDDPSSYPAVPESLSQAPACACLFLLQVLLISHICLHII